MTTPLLTIAMPAYNDELYVAAALESLLSQDLPDFELLISDNASTDRTGQICQDFARSDPRVVYHRNPTNIGATWNFNLLRRRAVGRYFMFAASHDMWHREFAAKCVAALEADPEIVLAYAQTEYVRADGSLIEVTPDRFDTRGIPAEERFVGLVWELDWCNLIYGVMRRSAYMRVPEISHPMLGPDHVILANMALLGTFAQIREPLFIRRQNRPDPTDDGLEDLWLRLGAQAAGVAPKRDEATRNLWWQHMRVLARSSLPPLARARTALRTTHGFAVRWGAFGPRVARVARQVPRTGPSISRERGIS